MKKKENCILIENVIKFPVKSIMNKLSFFISLRELNFNLITSVNEVDFLLKFGGFLFFRIKWKLIFITIKYSEMKT